VSRGTRGGGGVTRIGDKNLFMAYTHIAHDANVGSRIVFANAATLAGHVEVGDDATVGAFSGVHQFCRDRAGTRSSAGTPSSRRTRCRGCLTVGNRAVSHGVNIVGLKRKGYPQETVDAIKRCYTTSSARSCSWTRRSPRSRRSRARSPRSATFLDFVRSSKRGVVR
jgi:UDP-N-acetylglucosamine acyltransferase